MDDGHPMWPAIAVVSEAGVQDGVEAMPVVVSSLCVKRGKNCSRRQFARFAVHKPLSSPPKDGYGHILLVLVSPGLLSELSAFTAIFPFTDDFLMIVLIRMMNHVGHEAHFPPQSLPDNED